MIVNHVGEMDPEVNPENGGNKSDGHETLRPTETSKTPDITSATPSA